MSKRKKRPPELTAAETAAVMENMLEALDHARQLRELEKKVQLLEKLKKIKPAPTTMTRLPINNEQCPFWLPQDPAVSHDQRRRCVRYGPHSEHSVTYLIEEQCLD